MDMEPSEAEPYVLEETSTTVAPVALREIPQDIIDEILDHLTADNNSHSRLSLLSCSLVSKSWVTPCRRHLFRTAYFTWRYIAIWLETFPVPEESPAHHVRELCFWCGWCFDAPEKFFEYIPWFTGVRKIVWSGQAELEPLCRILSSGRLSQSVTSLAIYMDSVTVLQIRDVMDRLPNLNDLSLSGSLVRMDKNKLIGIGTGLRGKFGGRLRLLRGHVDTGIVNMLLEVPAGLHFTEVYIHSASERLRPTLRLTEACAESLAKLTYTVDDYSEAIPFLLAHENFYSKFPPTQMATRLLTNPSTLRNFQASKNSSFRSIGPLEASFGLLQPFQHSNPSLRRIYPSSDSNSVNLENGSSTTCCSSRTKLSGSGVNSRER